MSRPASALPSLHMWNSNCGVHAERFDNPPPTMKALADLLILQGKPRAALNVYEEMPDTQNGQQQLALARVYEEAGETQKSFELLLRGIESP